MITVEIFDKTYKLDNTGNLTLTYSEFRELCNHPEILKRNPSAIVKEINSTMLIEILFSMGVPIHSLTVEMVKYGKIT